MRFGKIQYLNLVPFDVFLKSYPLHSRFKLAAFARKSYPAKLNQSFFFRRIDAGFISTIAGYKSHQKRKATCAGIIAKGAVWSVLAIDIDSGGVDSRLESTLDSGIKAAPAISAKAPTNAPATSAHAPKIPRKDYQSDTSNILCEVLGLRGSVLIGDRALQYRFSGGRAIDMGQQWWDRHRLPFVFGRLCYNSHAALYTKLTNTFTKRRVKIPHYILQARALESGIPRDYIKAYLTHIHYGIGVKERLGLDRFYRAVRLCGLKPPKRIYPKAHNAIHHKTGRTHNV